MAKRDLAKIGVTSLEQLEQPLPEGITVIAKVVLHRDDNGQEFNKVSRFDVVGIEPPEPEPFAPPSEIQSVASASDEPSNSESDYKPDSSRSETDGQENPPVPGRGRGRKSRS
jgi:hypothetical protein